MKRFCCLLAAALLLSTTARAETAAGPAQVLDRFHGAAAEADEDTYLSLLTEDMVFLGTDGSERWQGQAFRDFVDENFSAGRGWRYTPQERNVSVGADGRTAWFDEMLHNKSLGQCRGSGVLINTGRGWKIAQYNLSVPVPNELVLEVVDDIAALESGERPVVETEVVQPQEQSVSDAPARTDCGQRRHKTNKKAGC